MYAPRPGLHFCTVDDIVVFLDGPGDRYFGLSPALSTIFLALSQAAATGASVDFDRVRSFVERGILVPDGEPSAWIQPKSQYPRREWQSDGGRSNLVYLGLAWTCIVTTLWRLRTRSFEQAFGGKTIRAKFRRTNLPERAVSSFLSAVRFFPRRLDCLPASLSLRAYLTRLSIPSDLVVAVSLNPFAAHCWIEVGDMVIGDTIERVRDYVPIRRL